MMNGRSLAALVTSTLLVAGLPGAAVAGGDDDEILEVTISKQDAVRLSNLGQEVGDRSSAPGEAVEDGTIKISFVKKSSEEGALPPGTQGFQGLNFGVGISSTFDLGQNDRVAEAELVAGLVRVTDQENVRARVMLESHYFFVPQPRCSDKDGSGSKAFLFGMVANTCNKTEWGIGPFVALQPGTDDIIDAIGMGIMLGLKRG